MAKLTIDRETCKGCGLCANVCPKHLLALSREINAKGYPSGSNSRTSASAAPSARACARMLSSKLKSKEEANPWVRKCS